MVIPFIGFAIRISNHGEKSGLGMRNDGKVWLQGIKMCLSSLKPCTKGCIQKLLASKLQKFILVLFWCKTIAIKNLKKMNMIFKLLTSIYLLFVFLSLLIKYLFRAKSLDEITNLFIEYVFLPVRSNPEKSFLKRTISYTTIFILLLCVISGIPFVRDYIISNCFPKEILMKLQKNNELFSSWLDFLDIFLSVLILISFGGFIFTDFVANKFKNVCSHYQSEIQLILDGNLSSLETSMNTYIQEYWDLLQLLKLQIPENIRVNNQNLINSITTYFLYIKKLYKIIFAMQNNLLNDIPLHYKNYLVFSFYSNFPGGLYGLMIFVLFIAGIVFKVFKLYLASPLLK